MNIIPLQAVPAQTVGVVLASQNCRITVKQRRTGVYLDLYVDDRLLVGGVICQVNNRIVRSEYTGFVGNLAFIDTQMDAEVDLVSHDGIGTRFFLIYYP